MVAVIFGALGVVLGWVGCAVWCMLQTESVFLSGYREGYAHGMADKRTGRRTEDWTRP